MSLADWQFQGDACASKLQSPSKRRAAKLDHFAAIMHLPSGITYHIGDGVMISPRAVRAVPIISPMLVSFPPKTKSPKKSPAKAAKNREKKKKEIQDGLPDDALVGILIDLWKNERDEPTAKIHWLYRPRIALEVWADWEKEDIDVLGNELFYATDPYYFEDYHMHMERDGHLPPSFTHKLSKAQDSISITLITSKVQLVATPQEAVSHSGQKTFLVRRFWNPQPDEDNHEEFLQLFDFNSTRTWGLGSGWWEIQKDPSELYETKSPRKAPKSPTKRKAAPVDDPFESSTPKKKRKVASAPVGDSADESERPAEASESDSESDSGEESQDFQDQASSDSSGGDSEGDGSEDDAYGAELAGEESEEEAYAHATKTPTKRRTARRAALRENVIKKSAAQLRHEAEHEERKARRIQARQERMRAKLSVPKKKQTKNGHQTSAFQRARAALHVSATPDFLPCRDEQFADVEGYLEDAIDEGRGSCIYIAGVPGTGKTATVRSVVQSLLQRASDQEIKPFRFVEINAMKLSEPVQAYSALWDFISDGKKAAPKLALAELDKHFKYPSPGRQTCVALIDEVDQLRIKSKRNDVIYNLFNWPNQPHSKLVVITIANTMDLFERCFSSKIRSRLSSNEIKFLPYTHQQLIEILESRLNEVKGECIEDKAVELAARKVAGVTGDARRALDFCRRAIEKVEAENEANKLKGLSARMVTTKDINQVVKEASTQGKEFWLHQASLHQKIMLLGAAQTALKEGVQSIPLTQVMQWHWKWLSLMGIKQEPTLEQLMAVFRSLTASKLLLTDSGLNAGLDHYQMVSPAIENSALTAALDDDPQFKFYMKRLRWDTRPEDA